MKSLTKRALMLLALACAFTITTVSAGAQNTKATDTTQTPPKILRTIYQGESHVGHCCTAWDASITVNEPQDKLVPIVVTFSMDYNATARFYAGLRLNDGVCAFYGPENIAAFPSADGTSYTSATFQWVILPGDYKLKKGANVVTVCGGAADPFTETDSITLGLNTLTAELAR